MRAFPEFYRPDHAGDFHYRPDVGQILRVADATCPEIRPATRDNPSIALLIIDAQRDFCHPEGTLYVGGQDGLGPIGDSRRIAEFIYGNLEMISLMALTMDSHQPFHIFSPAAWRDSSGARLSPHSVILATGGVLRWGVYDPAGGFATSTGTVRLEGRAELDPHFLAAQSVDRAAAERQMLYYCDRLAQSGKYLLYLWPEHCLEGSLGHTLVGLIDEARLFWCFARGASAIIAAKGQQAWTECYSVFGPEVGQWHDGTSLGGRQDQLLETLLSQDAILVCGQAGSHCVRASIDDLLERIQAIDPALTDKIHIATDMTSPVMVPDGKGGWAADFSGVMADSFLRYRQAGMHLVTSQTKIADWPGLKI